MRCLKSGFTCSLMARRGLLSLAHSRGPSSGSSHSAPCLVPAAALSTLPSVPLRSQPPPPSRGQPLPVSLGIVTAVPDTPKHILRMAPTLIRASYSFVSVDGLDLLGHEHRSLGPAVRPGCQDTLTGGCWETLNNKSKFPLVYRFYCKDKLRLLV